MFYAASTVENWQAGLRLAYQQQAGRTVLTQRQHYGPLRIQKALYPEGQGICHTLLLHPPGGIAGGDRLNLNLQLGAGSHAVITTPGAGKWYKSQGKPAYWQQHSQVADGACLEWWPQENLLYNQAEAHSHHRVELSGRAVYCGWDIQVFGRRACGETFAQGQWQQGLEIYRDTRLLWFEQARLSGGDVRLHSDIGLRGFTVSASLILAAPILPTAVLAHCRQLQTRDNALTGVSQLPDIFIARYLGHHANAARRYFEQLCRLLRPHYAQQPFEQPRIWAC